MLRSKYIPHPLMISYPEFMASMSELALVSVQTGALLLEVPNKPVDETQSSLNSIYKNDLKLQDKFFFFLDRMDEYLCLTTNLPIYYLSF